MDPEKLKAALDAIEAGDKDAGMAILKELIAAAAGGGAPPAPVEELATETPPEEPPKDMPEELTALSLLTSITGTKDLKSAGLRLRSVVEYVDTARTNSKKIDDVTRLALVGELVKLGAETVGTAWADADKRVPCKRLQAVALDDLQDQVTRLKADPTRKTLVAVEPPAGGGTEGAPVAEQATPIDVAAEVKKLSAPLLEDIKKKGMTPEAFVTERNRVTHRHTR